eukprot:403347667
MIFNESVFENNTSLEGGTMNLQDQFNATLIDVKISNSHAKNYGGAFKVTISDSYEYTSVLILTGASSIINNNSADYGGLIYSSNQQTQITLKDVTISNTIAYKEGGLISFSEGANINIENSNLINFQSIYGGLIYSVSEDMNLYISNSFIQCQQDQSNYLPSMRLRDSQIYIDDASQVSFSANTFQNCNNDYAGGLITLSGTRFNDIDSTYLNNSGKLGGVIFADTSQIYLTNCTFISNQASIGGVLNVQQQTQVQLDDCHFEGNIASKQAGVFYSTTNSQLKATSCIFLANFAAVETSVIDILGSNYSKSTIFDNCTFKHNSASKNALSFMYSNIEIYNSQFIDNYAQQRSRNIFLGFTSIIIKNCSFIQTSSSVISQFPYPSLIADNVYGAYFFIIFDAQIQIENVTFMNGSASIGGAIYVQGESAISIMNSIFQGNTAKDKGGAIYASAFESLDISGNTLFINNDALYLGDDVYISNTVLNFTMTDVMATNLYSSGSIYVEQAQVYFQNVTFKDISLPTSKSSQGAGLRCLNCAKIHINECNFFNLQSYFGGALSIEEADTNKDLSSSSSRYEIFNSTFQNNFAIVGGAIFVDNVQNLLLIGNKFLQNSVNNSYSLETQDQVGSGGAIYYTCDSITLNCILNVSQDNQFIGNHATIQGGAIYWNTLEPIFDYQESIFESNKADQYGNDIACYAQQIGVITQSLYQKQLIFLGILNGEDYDERRVLQSQIDIQVNFTEEFVVDAQRSGGTLPPTYMALIDKYGQIVGSNFDSKVFALVNTTFNENPLANAYPPVSEGTNQYTIQGGVFVINQVIFDGTPGYEYSLILQSDAIDTTKKSNSEFMKRTGRWSLNLHAVIKLRECIVGEQFTVAGKCVLCENSYALVKQTSPGDCTACPNEKAYCFGGNQIGPKPGYWRKSNSSSVITQCMYLHACLGMISPKYVPMGECETGYQGVLCADCQVTFSRSGEYKCAKCPDQATNIVRLVFIFLGVIFLIVFMIRSTLNGAKDKQNITNIFLKIMLNHFQLIMMTSTFDFEWSQQILDFFTESKQVATVSTQIFSFDCFLDTRGTNQTSSDQNPFEYIPTQDNGFIRIFFQKLVMIALLPIILVLCSFGAWHLIRCISRRQFDVLGKAISSTVIVLFLAHPSIIQYMFFNFKCKEIDGEERVLNDLEVLCWDTQHKFFSYFVALPSIFLWGLGIPFFAFILMLKVKNNLDLIEVREKFGFLYRGYRNDFYYWEIVIMYRKILIIFIAVFVKNFGVIAQALVVFIVLIAFLMTNTEKQPFSTKALNDLETLSLITSMITIYCGIFFVINKPQSWIDQNPDYSKGAISLSDAVQKFFFAVILISNISFFAFWCFKMYQEIKAKFRKMLPRIYLGMCLCFNKKSLEQENIEHEIFMLNQTYKEQLMKIYKVQLDLYNNGDLQLNQNSIERLKIYLNRNSILSAAGMKTQKDIHVFQKNIVRQKRVKQTKKQNKTIDGDIHDIIEEESQYGDEYYNEEYQQVTPQAFQSSTILNGNDMDNFVNRSQFDNNNRTKQSQLAHQKSSTTQSYNSEKYQLRMKNRRPIYQYSDQKLIQQYMDDVELISKENQGTYSTIAKGKSMLKNFASRAKLKQKAQEIYQNIPNGSFMDQSREEDSHSFQSKSIEKSNDNRNKDFTDLSLIKQETSYQAYLDIPAKWRKLEESKAKYDNEQRLSRAVQIVMRGEKWKNKAKLKKQREKQMKGSLFVSRPKMVEGKQLQKFIIKEKTKINIQSEDENENSQKILIQKDEEFIEHKGIQLDQDTRESKKNSINKTPSDSNSKELIKFENEPRVVYSQKQSREKNGLNDLLVDSIDKQDTDDKQEEESQNKMSYKIGSSPFKSAYDESLNVTYQQLQYKSKQKQNSNNLLILEPTKKKTEILDKKQEDNNEQNLNINRKKNKRIIQNLEIEFSQESISEESIQKAKEEQQKNIHSKSKDRRQQKKPAHKFILESASSSNRSNLEKDSDRFMESNRKMLFD